MVVLDDDTRRVSQGHFALRRARSDAGRQGLSHVVLSLHTTCSVLKWQLLKIPTATVVFLS